MSFSMNMYSRDFFSNDVMNSICLGGPKHMLITELFDGDSFDFSHSSYIQESDVNIYTYNKKIVHIREFRAYIYAYSEILNDQIFDWIEGCFDDIYHRIRYDHSTGNYKFFNLPLTYGISSNNQDPPMIYAPYIPFSYEYLEWHPEWYPPAGWDRGKLKEKKLQLKLDDKLFEL